MKRPEFITLDGASLNVALVLSFESEKAFVAFYISKIYQRKDIHVRRSNLKSIYKQAKAKEVKG